MANFEALLCSLPDRQLRNLSKMTPTGRSRSLPDRQLRKQSHVQAALSLGSLPDRQLRK